MGTTATLRRAAAALALGVLALGLTSCGPQRTFTYRIAVRGAVSADVGHFGRHVAATLRDPRGWSLGGAVAFRQVTGAADFTIWLSTAASVPSFSKSCSAQWSCRVGRNVVINETRWQHATLRWPYDLKSYRHFVVNHEVGHWLGLGHQRCRGQAGARAPVMAQQSQGGSHLGVCRFNPWPTAAELSAVAARHRVNARPSGVPSPDDPFGRLDRVVVERHPDGTPRRVRLIGWAIDADTTAPLTLAILVDGRPVTVARADRPRPDVAEVYPGYGANHSYDVALDVPRNAGTVCVQALGVGSGSSATTVGCQIVK